MNHKPQGWINESGRHSLASRGIRTRPELTPYERSKVVYVTRSNEPYTPEKLKTILDGYISDPKYDGFETPEGQAKFLSGILSDAIETIEGESGLEYEYSADQSSIVVRIYGETWFDSKVDRYDPWDFTVIVGGILITMTENALSENIASSR